jgi:hypothetical protein
MIHDTNTPNRILLPEVGFYRPLRVESGEVTIRDGSALPFLIEEVIAVGAVDIALDPFPFGGEVLDSLPSPMRERTVLLEYDNEMDRQVRALFEPIAEDIGL